MVHHGLPGLAKRAVLRPAPASPVFPPPPTVTMHPPASVALPALPAFVDHLQQACDGHEMGFYFEEGGCWGMALALHEVLNDPATWAGTGVVERPLVQMRARTEGFVHAFVSVGDLMVDYRGAWRAPNPSNSLPCDDAQLRALARRFGIPPDDLEADLASARAVIETALLWTATEPVQEPHERPHRTLGAAVGH